MDTAACKIHSETRSPTEKKKERKKKKGNKEVCASLSLFHFISISFRKEGISNVLI